MRVEAKRLAATGSAGLTIGILTILAQVSFATLLFTGPLRNELGLGVGMALAGAVVIGTVMSLLGSFPGTVGRPHELPVVVLALLAARLVSRLPLSAPEADPLATVLVLIAGTTALFGGVALLLGQCRAGDLFRFLPYPVLGGFVAGSGALLIKGGITVMLGIGADIPPWPLLVQGAELGRWLPGVLFAVAMAITARSRSSGLTIPLFMLGGILFFHALLAWSHGSLAWAQQAGLLPEPPDPNARGVLALLQARGPIAWGLLARQLPDILSVVFIAVLGTLLNASAIEVTVRRELDLNQDLKAVGLANLLAACLGSPAGFHSLSSTALPDRMGVRGRGVGLVAAGVALAALVGGRELLVLIPYAVTGGLLVFLGLSLLANWLIDKRAYLSPLEFTVLLAILLFTVVGGWMAALIFGLILALLLFTSDYSRISAIRTVLSGRTRRSNVDRSDEKNRLLDRYGDAILIVGLQGHLFFGTAHVLLRTIRERLMVPTDHRPHWVLLDMRLTSGLDASAIYTFQRLRQICEEANIELVFSGLSEPTIALLRRADILRTPEPGSEWFTDLDHGLEHCENELLSFHEVGTSPAAAALPVPFEATTPEEREAGARLLAYFDPCEWGPGSVIIRQSDPPTDLYFLLSGRVVVERASENGGPPLRLRTMDPGTCVGEISFYLGTETTASVVTEGTVTALRLSLDSLRRMEERDPVAAGLLHKLVARRLGERLIATNRLALALAG
jgi:SulP family sulfate permease